MLDGRTIALGLIAFCVTFAGGWWLGIGNLTSAALGNAAVSNVASSVDAPARLPLLAKAAPVDAASAPGKGITENYGLRRAVILRAKAYQRPVCNQDARTLYIIAATRYAETLMRAAGCGNSPRCAIGEGMLDDVWRLNRSAADLEVAHAMAAVNRAGGLSERSFRGDVGRAVRVMAGADFRPGPGPSCVAATSTSSRLSGAVGSAVAKSVAKGVLSSIKRRRWSRFRLRFGR
jgi:hypothetical protein